ncbi:MAG TPA: prolipoprotein diacylglyceryl transferase [Rhodospirillaceae bacterium]|nr:prolipoprotein diacylglyceryl transferase [Rhodospirillaceae bacterium]
MGFAFPEISPVAIEILGFPVRWYSLAYLMGFLLGWKYCRYLAQLYPGRPNRSDIDDFLGWIVLGVILGGRLGYVFVYQWDYYSQNLLEIPKVWHGGMSFHGGLVGVVAVIVLYAWRRKLSILALGDIVAAAAPIGLFFGRLANFANGELYGRITTVSWAVRFPAGGYLPRHPSQLYEAALEGVALFVLLHALSRMETFRRRKGFIFGVFLIGYGVFRILVEQFREPDSQLGFLSSGMTMGQMVSLPMVAIGVILVFFVFSKKPS